MRKSRLFFISLGILFLYSSFVKAQNKNEEESFEENVQLDLITDAPLTIDLEEELDKPDEEKKKKEKRKKNVYFGIKTKKGFTKSGYGNNIKIELFNYLKEFQEPNPYVRDIHWYDFKTGRIRVGGKIDPKYGAILHGPYKMIQNEQVLEEGIFYVGAKHGRWTSYAKMYDYFILTDKKKYYKGWPKESMVSYYDRERTKLREVIPMEHEKKEGAYFYFHENGLLAVQGEYRNDAKVGRWVEYYEYRRQRKREVQYPTDPYDDGFRPYIVKEWDKTGEVIYDKEEQDRKLTSRF